jgi:hypothetical protein
LSLAAPLQEAGPDGVLEPTFAGRAATFLATSSFFGFQALSLLSARPSASWAKSARNGLLYAIAFILSLGGGTILIGIIFTLTLDPHSIYGLWFPAGIAILWAMTRDALREADVPRQMPKATPGKVLALGFAPIVVPLFLLVGLAVVFAAIGYGNEYLLVTTPLWPLLLGAFVLPSIVAAILNREVERRDGQKVALIPMVFAGLHRWTVLSEEESTAAQAKAHQLPRGWAIRQAWMCHHCPMVRIDYNDVAGTLCSVYLGLPKLPWYEWFGGLLVARGVRNATHRETPRLRLLIRGCEWRPMPQTQLSDALARISPDAELTALGWWCRTCPAERIDLLDAEGRDFMLIANPPDDELAWVAGYFVGFARMPRLASDLPQPEPATKAA